MSAEIKIPETSSENYEPLAGREVAEQAFASVELELAELVDADTVEAIKDSGAELIEAFKINPELFDSKIHTLLFAAIAKRASEISIDDQAGQEFIADATMLLALQHSDRYDQVKDTIETDDEDGPERVAAYDKFTDQELTKQVEVAIKSGLLDGVRQRLGVTDDNEDPYEIRVLDLGDESSLMGLQPSVPQDMSDSNAWAIYEKDNEAYEAYKTTMLANLDSFAVDSGIGGRIPAAWNVQVDGKTVLCLPSPTAKMILDGNAIKSRWYTRRETEGDNSYESDLFALVEHEYAHTQGGVALDRNVFYGITAEEFRVENASGNKHGYRDAKIFMRQVAVLTGFDATEYFDNNVKGGGGHFFQDMASVVGIDAMLEIALVPPSTYIEDTRKMHQSVNEHLGGYNGVLTRLYDNAKNDAGMQERMDAFKTRMRTFPPHVRESWLASQQGGYKMPFVADLYKDIAEE